MNRHIDFNALIQEIGKCCLSEDHCNSCQKDDCLIGYCEQSLLTCFKQQDEFIDGGMDRIPYNDTKIYDEEALINSIIFILNQCKNCQLYHDEDCIINIIRSAMEVALFGDALDYKGSNFMYFADLERTNKEISKKILSVFKPI
ncbi:hypothetical protein CLPU_7c00120 [Gottschalkia purinilytica]|uniref:Uncharacterized protein n=1 Tax=Gottschalkia purinilytica TaxID=1503 RepID=A0A0L0WA32_GOTPU|nr:hypothetical protein [Gottschalkia purinilytica]KNF08384.1 hypothetical protein CLPU_7c00120 [Gottschalkia purinilytica]